MAPFTSVITLFALFVACVSGQATARIRYFGAQGCAGTPTEVLVASGVCQTSSSVSGVGSYKVTCSGAGGSAVYSAASDCTSAGEIPPGGFTSGRCYTAPGAAVAPAAQSFAITCGEGGLSSASFAPVASSSGAPASAALAGAAALALAAAAAALALRVGRA